MSGLQPGGLYNYLYSIAGMLYEDIELFRGASTLA